MPYVNGKRVSLEQWKLLHPAKPLRFAGEEQPEEPVEVEAPTDKPRQRTKSKKAQVQAAIKAATGVKVESLDELPFMDDDE